MKISLVGYMASGKSQTGRALSSHLQLPFVDLDQALEAELGEPLRELIPRRGELFFRLAEQALLRKVLTQPRFVLATGGGTPCYFANMDDLKAASFTVYLDVSGNELTRRLQEERGQRPLLAHLAEEELGDFVAKHLFERRPFYHQAHLRLTATETPTRINQIEAALK